MNGPFSHSRSHISKGIDLLVDFKEVVFFKKISCQWLSIADALEGRVHEACVAKVTETSGSGSDTPLMGRRGRRGVVFGLQLVHHCYYLLRP